MAWVEKDHNDHLVSTSCYVQGRQPADQAAQSHIQPGLECLQGWGIHSLLGQPVQCVITLWVKNFLLISNVNLLCWFYDSNSLAVAVIGWDIPMPSWDVVKHHELVLEYQNNTVTFLNKINYWFMFHCTSVRHCGTLSLEPLFPIIW